MLGMLYTLCMSPVRQPDFSQLIERPAFSELDRCAAILPLEMIETQI